jgi:hypothetical protein
MARVIVDYRFEAPMTDEQLEKQARRLDPCLEIRDGAWRRSAISKDRLRMTCEFEAPDADSVRQALRAANIPFAEVWSVDVYAVEDYPELKAKVDELVAKKR